MWVLVFLLCQILIIPIYFLSVSHLYLQEKFGIESGNRIGSYLGLISGWGFFGFWIAIWLSPQSRFAIPIIQELIVVIPFVNLSIPFLHLVLAVLFLLPGAFLGIEGVREMGLEAAEKHRSDYLITSGVYSRVRHPQYLGALLSHSGMSFLVSGLYSMLATPIMILLCVLYSWKEERELVSEFGEEYREYARRVPMYIPKFYPGKQ